jgi:hypothetical protein
VIHCCILVQIVREMSVFSHAFLPTAANSAQHDLARNIRAEAFAPFAHINDKVRVYAKKLET